MIMSRIEKMGVVIIALVLVQMFLFSSKDSKIIYKQSTITDVKTKYVVKDEKFSEARLKEFILELNLKFPEIVLAQAKLESGNFKSRAFLQQNNLFGLHVAKQRPTLAKKGSGLLAKYNTWKESVIDYAFLVADRLRKIDSQEEYLAYLDKNYDIPGYSDKLKKFLN